MDKIDLNIQGLSKEEAQVYVALLSLKQATVLQLARYSQLKRGNLYRVLEKLIGLGLVSETYIGKKHYFIAEAPAQLLRYLGEQRKKITELLPYLEAIEKKESPKLKVKYYEGQEGARALYREIYAEHGGDVVMFGDTDQLYRQIEAHPSTIKERIKRGIKARAILPDSPMSRDSLKRGPKEQRDVKLIKAFKTGKTFFIVSPTKAAIFSLTNWLTDVVIDDKEIAQTLRALFELIWKKYK